jgi:hypothetical protein
MAAREHQGLQISLIIFVILTVVLSVATFMFARKLAEERDRNKTLAEEKTSAEKKASDADALMKEALPLIGAAENDTPEKVKQDFDKFKANYLPLSSVTAPAAKAAEAEAKPEKPVEVMSYPSLVEQLVKGIVFRDGVTADLMSQKDKLKKDYDDAIVKHESVKKAAEDAQKKAQDEREKVQKDTAEQIAAANKAKEEVSTQLSKKGEEFTAAETQAKAQLTKTQSQLARADSDRKVLAEKVARSQQQQHEVPDGAVTWVSAGERVVYINLGQADFLRPQVSFAVYPSEVTDVVTSKSKAKIEVTRVLGPHEAECRIVEDSVTDPILPQDRIYSPVWHPGRRIHFAITGRTDIDGDGDSDREKVRDLIRINGGVIDAEVTDDGKLVGALSSANTRYIIIGERPTDTKDAKIVDKHVQLMQQAKELGIAEMNLQQFLDMMGFKSDERTVNLGRGADPRDFRAKDTSGATKRKNAEPFRERRPPAKTKS